jgi:DmsE family decaheme c-type cytochrome
MRLKFSTAARWLTVLSACLFAGHAMAQATMTAKTGATPVCAKCHEETHKSIELTPHGAKNDADGTMCQACHGDATAHLKDPTKAKPTGPFTTKGATGAQKSAVCLTCHDSNRQLAFWAAGAHSRNDVSCASCHNIHNKPGKVVVSPFTTSMRPNEADLCGTCHQQIRSATFKPSHHPIVENKIKCSDCHNPHGALTPAMLRAETVNQQCYSCHSEKRGPYLFAHPAVEENCLSCHNPHGSVYAKLLNEKMPNLCQDCHDTARHPGTVYGGAAGFNNPATGSPPNPTINTRFIARACTNCHNSIHGSNAPGSRGQYFIR